jgi:pimeloyl-ACP methyl ester carboxylesterase
METNYRVRNPDAGGVPLVFIHGVGDSIDSWNNVIALLPQDRPFVTYDLRGHGQSERVQPPYSIDDFVQDFVELIQRLGYGQVDVAGYSLGGLIAQGLAIYKPERIRRLIAVGSVADRTAEERARVLSRLAEVETAGPLAVAIQSVDRWYTPQYLAANPAARQQTIDKMAALDPACYAAAYRVLATTDFAKQLSQVSAPTLAIAGEGDVGSPPHMSEYIANAVENGRCVVIPGVKHNILQETAVLTAKEIINHVQ